ncbi:unnamed protein product [Closterium sp. NIES-65]|nr:unnamed protein product [Closterium sp. NIES-65]
MDDSWAWLGRPCLDGIAEQVLLGNVIMRRDAVLGEERGRSGGGDGRGLNGDGRGLNGDGRGLNGDGRGLNGDGRGLNGDGRGLNGDGRGLNGDGRGLNGDGRGLNGDGRGLNCDGRGLNGDGAEIPGGPTTFKSGGLAGGDERDTEAGCPEGYVTVAARDLTRSWFPEGRCQHHEPREETQQQEQMQQKQGQSQEQQGQQKLPQQQFAQAQDEEAAPAAAAAAVSGDAEQMVRELRESSARLKAVGQDPLPDALRLAEAAKAQARNGGLREEREDVQSSKVRGRGRKERVGLEQVKEEEEEEEGEEDRRTSEVGMRREGKKNMEEEGTRVASETGLEVLGKREGERRRRGEDGREEDGEGRDGGGRRRRMMDPQPTARILEWSDDDGELEETQEPAQPQGPSNRHGRTSMPATVHLRTPSAPHLSPLNLHAAAAGAAGGSAARSGVEQGVRRGGTVTATGKLRRPKRPFSAEETNTLKIGVMRFGKSWTRMISCQAGVSNAVETGGAVL